PESRLEVGAQQTYFFGLAFSSDGTKLYASVASLTDATGVHPGNTGNGIAVYAFDQGRVSPAGFLKVPLQPLAPGKRLTAAIPGLPAGKVVPYPAGLALVRNQERDTGEPKDRLLVADNMSDDALLLDGATGGVLHRYDLSRADYVPASYP